MEITTRTFTDEEWTEHEQFVQMFRAAKQRKQEWQKKMGVVLAEKAAKIRKRRAEIDKLFEEEFSDMDKELYTPEEAYDMTMKDIKAIYDPETGEYLNDETMQAIEDVRSGKEPVYEMKSMDEFKAWCEAL